MQEATFSLGGPDSTDQDTKAPVGTVEFERELEIFRQLRNEFAAEISAVYTRRELRDNQKNIADMRAKKALLPDETYIPDRTIEQNINANKTPYVNFIEQPTTVISFIDPQHPTIPFTIPARFVTDLIRYEGWQEPWHKVIDSMATHGCGFLEVRLDPTKPGRFANEYIRREDILIPRKTRSIQHCARVGRTYEITKQQFKEFTQEFGFDKTVAAQVEEHYKSKTEFIKIFKYFIKDESSKVSVAWFAEETISASTWLKAPEPFYIGDFYVDETGMQPPQPLQAMHIPIYDFPYSVKEDEEILCVQGEVALSVHIQEALSGLYSATVNGATRAAGLYAGRSAGPGSVPENKELYPLKSGYVHDGDVTFFSLPWPNTVALSIAQALSVRNAQQSGQTDFAAMSRNDTAKRATEIVAAREESDKLKSTRIALFSRKCLAIARCHWNIILNQIKISGIQLPGDDRDPADPIRALYGGLLSETITICMSADSQVVEKEMRKNQLLQIFPLIANTAFAEPVLLSILAEMFPTDMPQWSLAVQQKLAMADQTSKLLTAAHATMMAVPPQATATIPQYNQVLDALQQAIQPQNGQPNQGQPPVMAQ